MVSQNIKNKFSDFHLWYTGGLFIFVSILLAVSYYYYNMIVINYELLLKLFILLSIGFAFIIMSTPISKLIASNRHFQLWYIQYKEKEAMRRWRSERK